MECLKRKGIDSSIYYPHPLPRMPYYKNKYGFIEDNFKNATHISDGIISLPVGPHLNENDMHFIVESFKEIWNELDVL